MIKIGHRVKSCLDLTCKALWESSSEAEQDKTLPFNIGTSEGPCEIFFWKGISKGICDFKLEHDK